MNTHDCTQFHKKSPCPYPNSRGHFHHTIFHATHQYTRILALSSFQWYKFVEMWLKYILSIHNAGTFGTRLLTYYRLLSSIWQDASMIMSASTICGPNCGRPSMLCSIARMRPHDVQSCPRLLLHHLRKHRPWLQFPIPASRCVGY